MRAIQIIQRQFQRDLEGVHLARLRVVFEAVFTALRCGQLSLTALGRAIAQHTTHKHGIKRIDRLLGNPRLHEERLLFYRAIIRRVIVVGSTPPIIIDWTAVTPKLWALVAAVSFQGRAVTIYSETHPISRYQNREVVSRFVLRLAELLPPGCSPVILGDAGFRGPFVRLVEGLGWHYVVRVRGQLKVRFQYGRGWTRLSFIFGLVGSESKDFGRVEVGQQRPFVARLVGIRRPVRHRKYHSIIRHHTVTWREKRAAHEPWILATSLSLETPRIIALYARRMQIEETFRDTKNPRFGMSLLHARPTMETRADVLLLLGSLAHVCALLLGIAAERARLDRGFRANTVVARRVLSLVTLGRLLVGSGKESLVLAGLRAHAWSAFRTRVAVGLAF